MAGPYPPHEQAGTEGQPSPGQPAYSEPYPSDQYAFSVAPTPLPPYPGVYPGMLPPPASFEKPQRRRRTIWVGVLAVALVGLVVAAVLTIRIDQSTTGPATFTNAAVRTAIQNYLNALSTGNTEIIARNALCGMYDGIKDRRSDQALARLASDAFRKQFTRAEVTSIDKTVLWSSHQAQVLFTMQVTPASSASRRTLGAEQAVAQLLRQDNQLLVCSYLLRTAAQY